MTYGHKIIIRHFFHSVSGGGFDGDYQLGGGANVAGGDPMAFGRDHGWGLGSISADSRHARRKRKKWKEKIE